MSNTKNIRRAEARRIFFQNLRNQKKNEPKSSKEAKIKSWNFLNKKIRTNTNRYGSDSGGELGTRTPDFLRVMQAL